MLEQRHLILIVARDFASRLATAVMLTDSDGNAIYFNEAAERWAGQPFIEGRGMPAAEWSTMFVAFDEDGSVLPPERLPLMVTLAERVPAHRSFGVKGTDGEVRQVAATAFPLFAHTEEFVGAMTIFWGLRPKG